MWLLVLWPSFFTVWGFSSCQATMPTCVSMKITVFLSLYKILQSREMDFDQLKVFMHGLPPDCQENSLKDFLEGEFKCQRFQHEFACTYRPCGS